MSFKLFGLIDGEIWGTQVWALNIYNKNKGMLKAIEKKHTHANGNV